MSKIRITEARQGMLLEKSVYSSDKKILLSYGTVLNDKIIKKLGDIGIREVDIADLHTLYVTPMQKISSHLMETYLHLISGYSSEKTEGNLSDSMVDIVHQVKIAVERICKDEELLNFCVQMKILNNGQLFNHSVLTSVFAGLIAGSLELYDDLYNIMVGGLLHDIGCLEMPFLIGAKNLKSQEELLWKEHPVYGYYFAIQQNIPRNIADIILYHHENWDGSGYPKRLKGEEIPIGARIAGTCSSLSSHMYFDNMQPYEAMEYLYCSSNMYFDKRIVDAFVNNITLYPLGAMVRLTTGEVGIISNIRKNSGPRPIVNVFYNRFNKPLSEPRIIDLGKERTIFIKEILG